MTRNAHARALIGILVTAAAAAGSPPETEPATKPREQLEHMRLDREAGELILEARVIRRKADWLELVACSPRTREHESILVVPARPSDLHLGLILLGLEPGRPADWRQTEAGLEMEPARGPPVRVTVRGRGDARVPEVPITHWIRNEADGEPLPRATFLFTGSRFREFRGERFYSADRSGNIISLVHFGDEVLARSTRRTHRTDQEQWQPRSGRIPPKGTPIELVLRPAEAPGRARTAPAESP